MSILGHFSPVLVEIEDFEMSLVSFRFHTSWYNNIHVYGFWSFRAMSYFVFDRL